jgi:hypothetical protein
MPISTLTGRSRRAKKIFGTGEKKFRSEDHADLADCNVGERASREWRGFAMNIVIVAKEEEILIYTAESGLALFARNCWYSTSRISTAFLSIGSGNLPL